MMDKKVTKTQRRYQKRGDNIKGYEKIVNGKIIKSLTDRKI